MTLNLTGSQTGYNYQVGCGVGSINVGAEHYTMFSHGIHINNKAPYIIKLECGVGNIAVNFNQTLQDSIEKEIEVWTRNYTV